MKLLVPVIRYALFFADSMFRSACAWAGFFAFAFRSSLNGAANGDFKNIVIVQTGGIGDIIICLPVISALRLRYPGAEVVLITGSAGAAAAVKVFLSEQRITVCSSPADALSSADCIVHLRGNAGFLAAYMKNHRAFFLHGLSHRNALRFSPLYHAGLVKGKQIKNEHQYVSYRKMLRKAGIETPERPQINVRPEWVKSLNALLRAKEFPAGAPYAVIHSGARWEPRQWPVKRFAEVAARLWEERGLASILIGDETGKELSTLLSEKKARFVDLAGCLDLGALAALLGGCSIFIGNDSGPAHIAAAVGARGAVLYGPQSPELFGVLSDTIARCRADKYCSPCWQHICPFMPDNCMSAITLETIGTVL